MGVQGDSGKDVVYIELNDWEIDKDYPDYEPVATWVQFLEDYFLNESWVSENKLVVVWHLLDQSINLCITAPRDWVEANCPEMLTTYSKFLREPLYTGEVYGQWGRQFLPYKSENIGIKDVD